MERQALLDQLGLLVRQEQQVFKESKVSLDILDQVVPPVPLVLQEQQVVPEQLV